VTVEVHPQRRATAEVRGPAPTFVVDTDDDGRTAIDVPPGLFSLVLRSPGSSDVQTSWVRL
jgi:hypothetical protein